MVPTQINKQQIVIYLDAFYITMSSSSALQNVKNHVVFCQEDFDDVSISQNYPKLKSEKTMNEDISKTTFSNICIFP